MEIINRHIDLIEKACDKNNVSTLFAFGSVTGKKFNSESDIDMIVDFRDSDPTTYSEHYFNLKNALEIIFHRKIDLLEARGLKNSNIQAQIERTKIQLYGI